MANDEVEIRFGFEFTGQGSLEGTKQVITNSDPHGTDQFISNEVVKTSEGEGIGSAGTETVDSIKKPGRIWALDEIIEGRGRYNRHTFRKLNVGEEIIAETTAQDAELYRINSQKPSRSLKRSSGT